MNPDTPASSSTAQQDAERLTMARRLKWQHAVAASTAILFFAIALWVARETYENVLFLGREAVRESARYTNIVNVLDQQYQAKVAELQVELDHLKSSLRAAEAEKRKMDAYLTSLEVTKNTKKAELNEIANKFQQLREDAEKNGYRFENDEIILPDWKEHPVDYLKAKASDLISKFNQSREDLQQVKETINTIDRQITIFTTQLDAIVTKIASLSDKELEIRSQFAELKRRLTDDILASQLPLVDNPIIKDSSKKLKHWQKNPNLRRAVGLLHITTGMYALILGLRSTLRWMQLKGICYSSSLVLPK
jgi:septal ring factor EnvC (AmiA/AmiB activator)